MTLIEMIVLIIVMALLSSVAVPAFSRLRDRAAFEAKVAQVMSFFTQTRAQAIELGMQVEVRFDPQSESFTARGDTTMTGQDLPTDIAATSETATVLYERSLALPSDYRIEDLQVFGPEAVAGTMASRTETVLYFHEDGTCDGLRFTLVRDTGHAAVITLWPTTGAVDVEPPS